MWCSSIFARTTLAAVVTAMSVGYANAQQFQAVFSGLNEIGGLGAGETGAILSTGQGTLRLTLNTQLQSLDYTLTYSNLGAPVTQSHIHFGRARVAGGIIVFLCSNVGGPVGVQACPSPSGTVTGTLTPVSIVGPVAQGISPANFAGLVTALTTQTSYGNIHTQAFPAGEIRGEIIQCPPNGCP